MVVRPSLHRKPRPATALRLWVNGCRSAGASFSSPSEIPTAGAQPLPSLLRQGTTLDPFGRVISVVTMAVSGIAGISLLVGAIGILTIMWISVHERTNEIGVLRALGETPSGVARLFLLEAVLIAAAGGLAGIAAGFGMGGLIRLLVPALPFSTPPAVVVAALAMSTVVGAASGYLPARRAASLDPVDALRAE
jgi:putative ABC transport system permease protein